MYIITVFMKSKQFHFIFNTILKELQINKNEKKL